MFTKCGRRIALATFGSLLALAGCAAGPSSETLAPSAAAPLTNVVQVEELAFPLPPGAWREVYTHNIPGTSPAAPQTFKVYASVTNGAIDRATVVWVQRKYSFPDKWRKFQGCLETSDPSVHHSVIKQNTGSPNDPSTGTKVDCWHVRNFSLGRSGGAHPIVEALHLFAQREGLFLPATMVGARFAQKRMTDRRSYVEYLWTPEVLIPKVGGGVWLQSDWTSDAVRSDAGRSIVVQRVVRWAEDWRSSILKAGPTS